MAKLRTEDRPEGDRKDSSQPVGDNRRAGDLDGNAAGGNSKSKGATNPPDQAPPAKVTD
jgi:hypothetical protein